MVHHLQENREEITQDKGSGPAFGSKREDYSKFGLRPSVEVFISRYCYGVRPSVEISSPWFTTFRRTEKITQVKGSGPALISSSLFAYCRVGKRRLFKFGLRPSVEVFISRYSYGIRPSVEISSS